MTADPCPILSDSVLETLLCRVFRNVELLEEYNCKGFSKVAFLHAMQGMPFLQIVRSFRDLHKTPWPRKDVLVHHHAGIVPFEQEAEAKVLHLFAWEHKSQFLGPKKEGDEVTIGESAVLAWRKGKGKIALSFTLAVSSFL